ncbi:MAG: protein kinase, partial [Myxococcota bacterium]
MGTTSDSFDAVLRQVAHAPPLPTADARLGAFVGPYRIEERLGAGGYGTVYRARDARLERDVALKFLPAGAAALEEARSAARLAHPNVARIYDVGGQDGEHFIAFELVAGPTVREWGPHARPNETLALARGLAAALAHLHEQGLVHGD